jgi:Ca-activated chloride channel family protein
MSPRRLALVIFGLVILALLALFGWRCQHQIPPVDAAEPTEQLTPATLQFPPEIKAGAILTVEWTGPDNPGDYIAIVSPETTVGGEKYYRQAREGKKLEITAPIETGPWEVRYIAAKSRTILGRSPLTVSSIEATLSAPAEVTQGTPITVEWTGPNNQGDYITIVPKDTPEGEYKNYTNTNTGSPLKLTAPIEPGEFELRYVTGQGNKVLARRPIVILAAQVTLAAADEGIAGAPLAVTWTGPNNAGDYITVVPKELPDGQYQNYTNTSAGSPLNVTLPIEPGEAELRYMTGQDAKVLARRPFKIVPAVITMTVPPKATVGTEISIAWTGPNNSGDYLTLVPKDLPDGQYKEYANTSAGSPLKLKAPFEAGTHEVRYMSGQGAKVLFRVPVELVTEKIEP